MSQVWKGLCSTWHSAGRWLAESQTSLPSIRHYNTEGSISLIHNYTSHRNVLHMSAGCLKYLQRNLAGSVQTNHDNVLSNHFAGCYQKGFAFRSRQTVSLLCAARSLMILSINTSTDASKQSSYTLSRLLLCSAHLRHNKDPAHTHLAPDGSSDQGERFRLEGFLSMKSAAYRHGIILLLR